MPPNTVFPELMCPKGNKKKKPEEAFLKLKTDRDPQSAAKCPQTNHRVRYAT